MRQVLHVLTLLLLTMILTPVHAQPFDMGPLNSFLKEEADQVWAIRNQGGAVVMENRSAPGHLNYYQTASSPGAEGQRTITLDVAVISSMPDSLAGILYGFQSQPKTYYMFTVGGDRSINLHQMINGRLESRMKWSGADLKAERTVLAIREEGNTIALSVNGIEKTSFGNDQIGHGAVGIVAGGVGTFRFSQFRVSYPDQTRANALPATPVRSAHMTGSTALALKPGKVIWHPVKDPNTGVLQRHWPLPEGWATAPPNHDRIVYEGPNGITV